MHLGFVPAFAHGLLSEREPITTAHYIWGQQPHQALALAYLGRLAVREHALGPAQAPRQTVPVETGAGVTFSACGDVLVARDVDQRITPNQGTQQPGQGRVLRGLEALAFQPFEFDAY